MGCDGGTICGRRDLIVKTKKLSKAVTDKLSLAKLNWTTCRLSKQLLEPKRIVCCRIGFLYDKVAILDHLVKMKQEKKELKNNSQAKKVNENSAFGHIRSKKDVLDLKFELNPDFDMQKDDPFEKSLYICPVMRKELNYLHKIYAVWICGHVVSEQALSLVEKNNSCPVCSKSYDKYTDLIVLNPPKEMETDARMKMEKLKEKKKGTKRKREQEIESEDTIQERDKILHNSPLPISS